MFATSNTCASDFNKFRSKGSCFALEQQNFIEILSYFMSLIVCGEWTSGERNKVIHAHIGGNKMIRLLIKQKKNMLALKTQRNPPKLFGNTQTKDP